MSVRLRARIEQFGSHGTDFDDYDDDDDDDDDHHHHHQQQQFLLSLVGHRASKNLAIWSCLRPS
jgi:hypothetical protein